MGDDPGLSKGLCADPPKDVTPDKSVVELSLASLEVIAKLVIKKLTSNPLKSPDTRDKDPPSDGKYSHAP